MRRSVRAVIAISLALLAACGGKDRKPTPREWLEEHTFLLEKLRSFDGNEQAEAIQAFRRTGKERGTQYALALLLDPTLEDYRVEVVLARLLADWRDPRAVEFLTPHLFHQDQSASRLAAEGLRVFADEPRLVEWLLARAGGPVLRERRIAVDLLSHSTSPEVIDFFRSRYLDEPDREVRALFLMAEPMVSRGPDRREHREFLARVLTDPDEGLRAHAWSRLEREERLPPELEFDPSADPAVRAGQVAQLRLWFER